ncbi:MAG: pre-peptidase C-terminal domain-containing protein [Magnetococcales bacterium]|nr:pre-peptidase C-terminal domain-containing protein [Magnetococcales bacterium]
MSRITTTTTDTAPNSRSKARNLGTLTETAQSITEYVGSSDRDDYYRFQIADAGSTLSVTLTSGDGDADVQLLGPTGTLLQSSGNRGRTSESIAMTNLAAGTYYVRVYPYSKATSGVAVNYVLTMKAEPPPEDHAGNDLSRAADLQQLGFASQSRNDFVGVVDANDYYLIETIWQSDVQISLADMSGDADIQLLNDRGDILRSGGSRDATADSLTYTDLAAGHYYVRIYPASKAVNTHYTAQFSATPVDHAGDDRGSARVLADSLEHSQSESDFVGIGDSDDFYQFNLAFDATVDLSFQDSPAGLQGVVVDETGVEQLLVADHYQLQAGRYFVHVYTDDDQAQLFYTLNLAAERAVLPSNSGNSEAGHDEASALAMTLDDQIQSFSGSVSGSVDDYYQFTLTATTGINLLLTGLTSDADLYLYDSQQNLIDWSMNFDTEDETIAVDQLVPGTYYVTVGAFSDQESFYALVVTASAGETAPDSGATMASAQPVTILLDQLIDPIYGVVDGSHQDNFYYFDLALTADVSLSLSGLSDDADLVLLDSDGMVIDFSGNGGHSDESIRVEQLDAGSGGVKRYYVHVYQAGDGETRYQLTIAAATATVVADGAGNTLQAARDIGQLGRVEQRFEDFVGVRDPSDYYQFQLATAANVSLGLSELEGDADLVLFDSNDRMIAYSINNGQDAEQIQANRLAAGNYKVWVCQLTGDSTRYTLSLSADPVISGDGAGDTLARARDLGTLTTAVQSWRDAVGGNDKNDYYKFRVTGNSALSVNLTDLANDADLALLDKDGKLLVASRQGGATDERIQYNLLTAGNYYLLVSPASGVTNYTLSLSAAAAVSNTVDQAGNDLRSAKLLGALGATEQSFDDFVGASDGDDYYQFQVVGPADFRLSLAGLSGDVDVSLLDQDGTVMEISANGGSRAETIHYDNLASGTYYAHVYTDRDSSNYRLTLAAETVAVSDHAPNTMQQAMDIGVPGADGRIMRDYVGSGDRDDYYQFTLDKRSSVHAVLSGLTANVTMAVLDDAGQVKLSTTTSGSSANTFVPEALDLDRLATGRYYVRISYAGSSGGTEYILNLSALDASPADTAGNQTSAAREVTVGGDEQQWNGFVGTDDTVDYYKFTLAATSNWALQLTDLVGDADVTLLKQDGSTVIATSRNGGNAPEEMAAELGAGSYYVKVEYKSGDTDYTLHMKAPAVITSNNPELADNTMARATSLGTLNATPVSKDGYVGNGDNNDYYKFSTAAISNFRLSMTGLSSNVDVQLLDRDGKVIRDSLNGGTDAETIQYDNLAKGDYYLRVYPYSDRAIRSRSLVSDSRYALTVAAGQPSTTTPVVVPGNLVTSTNDSWTILVYMAADNNLEAFGLQDINEMESVNLPNNVNVVVLVDRSAGYSTADGNWSDTRRGAIQHDNDTSRISSSLTSLGELDTGNPNTLANFVDWGTSNYRADRYALVVWDHGGGLSGTCSDDTSGSGLSVGDMTNAVAQSNIKFDIIGFDTCLQGMVEQVDDLRAYTGVVVASEQTEPGDGWAYDRWLSALSAGTTSTATMDAKALSKTIVDTFGASYANSGEKVTLSAIDTSKIPTLTARINDFTKAVLADTSTASWSKLRTARTGTAAVLDFPVEAGKPGWDYLDLGDYMNRVSSSFGTSSAIGKAARDVSQALTGAVIQQYSDFAGSSGLSVYLPGSKGELTSSYNGSNWAFLKDTNWDQFVGKLVV